MPRKLTARYVVYARRGALGCAWERKTARVTAEAASREIVRLEARGWKTKLRELARNETLTD